MVETREMIGVQQFEASGKSFAASSFGLNEFTPLQVDTLAWLAEAAAHMKKNRLSTELNKTDLLRKIQSKKNVISVFSKNEKAIEIAAWLLS